MSDTFQAVALYDLEGIFRGYSIIFSDARKLQTTNIYSEDEIGKLNTQLAALNQGVDLRDYWPNPKDPAVLTLLANAEFVPIEYEEREVIDDEKSHYVWIQEAEYDLESGLPTGRMVNGSVLDEDASVIRYKMAMVPKRPTDVMYRLKAACEAVARERVATLTT